MNVNTQYGTVYGVETLEKAQAIVAASDAEMEHESCPICRGALSLVECKRRNPALATPAEIPECPEPLQDPNYCPAAPETNKHKPDTTTLKVEYDGEHAYVDISCANCGRSGCVGKFDAEQVDW